MLFKKKSAVAGQPAGTPRRLSKPVLITLAAVLVIGSVVGFRATQAKKDEKKADAKVTLQFTPADVATVELRSLTRMIQFSGSLSPVVQTTVKSRVSGDLMRVLVREGETVSQGQLLAQIDTADLQARLDAQVAALEEAKAKLSIAEKNRENNLQLLRQKFISQNAYDTTHSTYEASAAMMRSAEAQLRIARKAMEDAAVRAPFAGIVAKKMANAGEKVGIDSPLFALVDLSRMEIEAPAPASEIPSVKVGQPASFRVDGYGERAFDGRVERINPTTEQGSRSITLYISVSNRDGALKGGMFAKGQIVLDKSTPAVVVPATAVRDESGQSYVYTLEGGKIGKRAVKVGVTEAQDGMVEIKSGLESGLTVVSARVTGLKHGDPAVMKAPEIMPANSTPPKAG
jgi:membrane fusion protein, multidrug efflux system